MIVFVDTREKKPWSFFPKSVRRKLDAGDYSVSGLLKCLRIERKGGVNELLANLGAGWPRFSRAMRRLSRYRYPLLVIEGDMTRLLRGSPYSTLPTATALWRLSEIVFRYRIPVLFVRREAFRTLPVIIKALRKNAHTWKGVPR